MSFEGLCLYCLISIPYWVMVGVWFLFLDDLELWVVILGGVVIFYFLILTLLLTNTPLAACAGAAIYGITLLFKFAPVWLQLGVFYLVTGVIAPVLLVNLAKFLFKTARLVLSKFGIAVRFLQSYGRLTPVEPTSTSLSPGCQLCDKCESIVTNSRLLSSSSWGLVEAVEKHHSFHDSRSLAASSASAVCHLCDLLWHCYPNWRDRGDSEALGVEIRSSVYLSGQSLTLRLYGQSGWVTTWLEIKEGPSKKRASVSPFPSANKA